MAWKRITKGSAGVPGEGTYTEWKALLAEEGFHQCVYCTVDEASFGGLRNFHVEHYRPKKRFPLLENDFNNLFFACAICNTFKGSDWPAEPAADRSVCAYPSPADCNYGDFIALDSNTGLLDGGTVEMKYVIHRLYLNRPQLVMHRRVEVALAAIDAYRAYLSTTSKSIKDVELLRKIVRALGDLIKLNAELRTARPYAAADVAR